MHHGQSRGSQKRKRMKIGGTFINFAEIGEGTRIMHHWFREGGMSLTKRLRFTDDQAMLAGSQKGLQKLIGKNKRHILRARLHK